MAGLRAAATNCHCLPGLAEWRRRQIDSAAGLTADPSAASGPLNAAAAAADAWPFAGNSTDGESFCLIHKGPRRRHSSISGDSPVSLAVFVTLIALVCWFAVRLALRPLQHHGGGLGKPFSRDIRHPPLDTGGQAEVRQAALAFNAMQERVRNSWPSARRFWRRSPTTRDTADADAAAPRKQRRRQRCAASSTDLAAMRRN